MKGSTVKKNEDKDNCLQNRWKNETTEKGFRTELALLKKAGL